MAELSVVIMTYNEVRNIRRCLQAVKDIADELIVVDSFSTDLTVEISKEEGARVVQNAFGGYIEQRAFCIAQTSKEWVLALDADEFVDDTLRRNIKSTIGKYT